MNEIADVLERAADLLWVRGRTRGVGQNSDGELCVVGAFLAARGCHPEATFARREIADVQTTFESYLAAHPELIVDRYRPHPDWAPGIADEGRFPAWVWNDTTDDDDLVIDTLRRCAKEVRACE